MYIIILFLFLFLFLFIFFCCMKMHHPFLSKHSIIPKYTDWDQIFLRKPHIITKERWTTSSSYYQPEFVKIFHRDEQNKEHYTYLSSMIQRNFNNKNTSYRYSITPDAIDTITFGESFLSCYKTHSMMVMIPIYIHLKNGLYAYQSYYGDYMSTERTKRRNGDSAKLCYTTACDIQKRKGTQVFLTKKEGIPLPLFVPLLSFYTYVYDITYWKSSFTLKPPFEIKECTTIRRVDFSPFSHRISISHEHIEYGIQRKYFYVFALHYKDECLGMFFFKEPHFSYKQKKAIESIGCILYKNYETCYAAFLYIITTIFRDKYGYRTLLFEDIGHNVPLLKMLKEEYGELYTVSTFYYIYNFRMTSLEREMDRVFVLVP